MPGLKGLDNFVKFDVKKFLEKKELVFISCEKNYEKKLDEEGRKVPDINKPRGLKFEINIDKDDTIYSIYDFNLKERKEEKKGSNFRKSITVWINNPKLEPEKFDNFAPGDKVFLKGVDEVETMQMTSHLIIVADDIVKVEKNEQQLQKQ
jgi:hypothetical protein